MVKEIINGFNLTGKYIVAVAENGTMNISGNSIECLERFNSVFALLSRDLERPQSGGPKRIPTPLLGRGAAETTEGSLRRDPTRRVPRLL